MGKKSKRDNRRDHSKGRGSNIPMFFRRLMNLEKEANNFFRNQLWSKAVNKYKESLGLVQQFQDGPIESHVLEAEVALRTNLMMVEYSRWRFDRVIQIYIDIQTRLIQMSPAKEKQVFLSFMCKSYGQLAMLRLDASKENKERVVSLIDTLVSEGMTDPNDVAKALVAVRVLRNLKQYDVAITLGEKLGRMSEYRNIATLENAISHLQRYRVEYYQQVDKDFSNDILVRVHDAYNEFGDVRKIVRGPRGDAYLMMLAQRHFLCHQVDDKQQSSQLCSNAMKHVKTLCDFGRHCFTVIKQVLVAAE